MSLFLTPGLIFTSTAAPPVANRGVLKSMLVAAVVRFTVSALTVRLLATTKLPPDAVPTRSMPVVLWNVSNILVNRLLLVSPDPNKSLTLVNNDTKLNAPNKPPALLKIEVVESMACVVCLGTKFTNPLTVLKGPVVAVFIPLVLTTKSLLLTLSYSNVTAVPLV